MKCIVKMHIPLQKKALTQYERSTYALNHTQTLPYSATALIACCSLASNDPGSAPGALLVGEPIKQVP